MDEETYKVLLECVDLLFPSTEGPSATVLSNLVDLIVAYENEHYPDDDGQPSEMQEWQDFDRDC
jgi:hypothetical protein